MMTDTERAAWLEERRKGIGGSDAPKIVLGEGYLVYLDKLGQLPPRDNDAMKWGRLLEEVVAQAYAEETGSVVSPPPRLITIHPEINWMRASLDRIACRQGGAIVNVQCKTTGWADGWGQPGTDEVPDAINLQVQHEMAVSGYAETDVPVLVRGSELRVYTVPRHEGIIEKLIEIEAAFWKKVQEQDAPDVDWQHPRTAEVIRGLFGVDAGEQVYLDERGDEIIEEWEIWKDRAKAASTEVERYRGMLEHLMAGAGSAMTAKHRYLKRTQVKVKEHMVKASEYVRLTLNKSKGTVYG